MPTARTQRRLPGFRFDAQAPPLAEVLPRMDVAAFVGFAASGPLDAPVAVESAAQFAALFGEDAPLAHDPRRGQPARAALAPAVRAFFRNGGRRCWVVRVARRRPDPAQSAGGAFFNTAGTVNASDAGAVGALDGARENYFPVPGLAVARFGADGSLAPRDLAPAFARARSEGSWSDGLRTGSALASRPVQLARVLSLGGREPTVELALGSPDDVAEGDLLRLSFKEQGYALVFAVGSVERDAAQSPPAAFRAGRRRVALVKGRNAVWFRTKAFDVPASPANEVGVSLFTREPAASSPPRDESARPPDFAEGFTATLGAAHADGDAVTLDLRQVALSDAPPPGSLLRVELSNGQPLLVSVRALGVREQAAATGKVIRVSGPGLQLLKSPPALPASARPACERLSFDLWVRKEDEYAFSLNDLAFDSRHGRFWGRLPTDEELFRASDAGSPRATPPAVVWWRPVGDIFRFPLAGFGAREGEIFFPVGMQAIPEHYLGPVRLPGTELERDGLARFDASLFLDDAMLDAGAEDLMLAADFVRYLAPRPRPLRGVHAALAVEEATIVAAPDAAQPGWDASRRRAPRPPAPSPPPERPEWWRFLDCREPHKYERVSAPPRGAFLRCDTRVVPAPELSTSDAFSRSGTYTLSWSEVVSASPPSDAKVTYVLEEAAEPDYSDAAVIFSGARTRFTIYGRRPGDYYYRARAVACCDTSDWSAGVAVRVAGSDGWAVRAAGDYSADTLLAVQRALLRMCAARGDLFAVLSLPEHYREDAAAEHVAALKLTPERAAPAGGVSALGYGEAHAFGFGALYHPWLVGREENRFGEIRATPPCGAACGVLARRALSRGAWVAPANEPVRDVVSLTPPLAPGRRLSLQESQVNVVRQEPRGFLSLSADTLSGDPDYRPINVRRLLMLLRRLALKLGASYVFEPNSPAFRRLVERGFNAMLDGMFVRGAFAGKTPETSYEVNVDSTLNTPRGVEQGRFVVEIRVAPSLPMTFLTIRLVQTGERGFVTEAS